MTGYSSHHRQRAAQAGMSGGLRKHLIARIREIDLEYGRAEIGASAAMAEIRAALRELDRGNPSNPRRQP